jgi:ribonuclease HII
VLIAGLDDAGRGSVIGPLIIGGVTFQDSEIPKLKSLGVKDSKALTPRRRTILSQEIKSLAARWEIVEISPADIDKIVFRGRKLYRLNWLEAVTMAEVIKKLQPDVAYVDASDVNEERFAQQIREVLPFNVKIVSEHKADSNYAIVSAASIIAKTYRDYAISLLREKYGNFGSGYPNDNLTKQYLIRRIEEGKGIPNFVRKSWKTVKHLT